MRPALKKTLVAFLIAADLLLLFSTVYLLWAANHIWDISVPGQTINTYTFANFGEEEIKFYCLVATWDTNHYPIKATLIGETLTCGMESKIDRLVEDSTKLPYGDQTIGTYYREKPGFYTLTYEKPDICNVEYDYLEYKLTTDYQNQTCVDSYPTWRG